MARSCRMLSFLLTAATVGLPTAAVRAAMPASAPEETAAAAQIRPATGPSAGAGPTAPLTSAPAVRSDDFEEIWLARIVMDELKGCKDADAMADLKVWLEAATLGRVACGRLDKLDVLNDMMYALRACQYCPLAAQLADWDYAKWLLENRQLSRLLFRAMGDVRSPDAALTRLHELKLAETKAVLAYPELAVAFATSQGSDSYYGQPNAASLTDSFRWYVNLASRSRYDLHKLPYELSRYLADTRLSLEERRWAAQKYANYGAPPYCYFDVPYDVAHFFQGTPRKLAGVPYTLTNILRLGGVCADQAYFASQVCKTLGIPASAVSGRGASGVGHVWVAALRVEGKSALWDSRTGRYKEHKYYTGELRSPANGQTILDCELMLTVAAAQLSLERREEADTATELARMVEQSRIGTAKPDLPDRQAGLTALEKLGQLYNQRHGQGNRLKAATKWIRPVRDFDASLVEDLLVVAMDRNLAHKPAWDILTQLAARKRIPVGHLDRFFNVLISRTGKEYPDFSCQMILDIVPTIDDAPQRMNAYFNAIGFYGSVSGMYGPRVDLQGRILIAVGDDYRRQGNNEKAVLAYYQAAWRCSDAAEVILTATEKAEEIYREAQRPDLAIGMYEKLLANVKKEGIAVQFRDQSVHYQLGRRLAKLYMETGQKGAASRVLNQIEN